MVGGRVGPGRTEDSMTSLHDLTVSRPGSDHKGASGAIATRANYKSVPSICPVFNGDTSNSAGRALCGRSRKMRPERAVCRTTGRLHVCSYCTCYGECYGEGHRGTCPCVRRSLLATIHFLRSKVVNCFSQMLHSFLTNKRIFSLKQIILNNNDFRRRT